MEDPSPPAYATFVQKDHDSIPQTASTAAMAHAAERDIEAKLADVNVEIKSDSKEEEEKEPRVGIACYGELTKLDDVANEFVLELVGIMHWKMKAKPNAKEGWTELAEPSFKPDIKFFNVNEDKLSESKHWVNEKEGIVVGSYCWQNHTREPLELQRFPFDRQILHVSWSSTNCQLVKWELPVEGLPSGLGAEMKDAFWTNLGNWRMISVEQTHLHPLFSQLILNVERRFQYYFWNIVFVLFLLVLMSFSVVCISPDDAGDRLSLTLTLVLTAVAYKYVIASQLPAISYLTLMDKYVLFSFFLLGVGVVENVIVKWISKSDSTRADYVDWLYFACVTGLWVLMHGFVLLAWATDMLKLNWLTVEKMNSVGEEIIYTSYSNNIGMEVDETNEALVAAMEDMQLEGGFIANLRSRAPTTWTPEQEQ